MISHKLYISIIIHVLLIIAFSIVLGLLILKVQSIKYSVLCIAAIVLVAGNLVRDLNRTNRNVKYFFDSIKNDDSSLSFPPVDKSTGMSELNQSMNRVNRQIQQLKIRNSQQEQYFQKILEHLATGIISYDNKGFIYHANSAARNLLGSETFTHLRQLDRIDNKLYTVIKNLKPYERRLVGISTERGDIQLSLKSTSFGSRENELMILSVQDIKHELDEKEVDSWMKLIRVLMHEIMNSITPITSLSESLSSIYQKGESIVSPSEIDEKKITTTIQGLKVISNQGKGLMNFVESYRKLTRIPRPELKSTKINDIFSRVQILSASLENSGQTKIIFESNNTDLEILVDENLICLVLINLIKNAIEANEKNPGGIVKVSSVTDKKNSTEICVSDNGPGISEENLDKIFVPFFTTRPNGSGIGLSLSRQIMAAHGGSLNVKSVPGVETIFCMTFRS
jgi:nitrogen fixation/metabolism regulation signal transduction histidine kinase